MAYVINKYNGTVLTNVEDGTVNSTTEIKLIGKNFAGYGEAQNENFLFLLENFANSSEPTKPLAGMIWYDTSSNKLKFYDGAKFKGVSSVDVSSTDPQGYAEGDLYYNDETGQLFVRNGAGEWVLVGPQSVGTGTTQMQSIELTDTLSVKHAVIAATIKDEVVYIISATEFTNSVTTAIPGFSVIKKGLTLINTDGTTGVTSSDHYYWGTSSNSLRLNGRLASDYVTVDSSAFTDLVTFSDTGFSVGNDTDVFFRIDTDTETPMIKMVRDSFKWYDSNTVNNSGSGNLVLEIKDTGVEPGIDSTYNLGTSAAKWLDVHAVNFNGTATQANTLRVGASYQSAATTASADTIAARDGSGNLTAFIFNGTATKARYADLAEKYTTETDLPAGTAVSVTGDVDFEVGPSGEENPICVGVVSTSPALMMNSEAPGQYIALTGRVPVRVQGPVLKGQAVHVWKDGVCRAEGNGAVCSTVVGIALHDVPASDGEMLVECILKV